MTLKSQPTQQLKIVQPAEINAAITSGKSFVANIVTAWCPDCTQRQAQHIEAFANRLAEHGIAVLQVNVQMIRGEFISAEHQALTELFGGHGYPRTVLIKNGEVLESDHVEVMTEAALSKLAARFIELLES